MTIVSLGHIVAEDTHGCESLGTELANHRLGLLGITLGQATGCLAHLHNQPLLGRFEGRERSQGRGIVFQEAGDPALQQGFGGMVDSPASPRQLVGPLDELLQAFLGIMQGVNSLPAVRGSRPWPPRRP